MTIETEKGETLEVHLYLEGGRLGTCLRIDGVPHHFERVQSREVAEDYRVDLDPDYTPRSDPFGFCYLLVPFSKR